MRIACGTILATTVCFVALGDSSMCDGHQSCVRECLNGKTNVTRGDAAPSDGYALLSRIGKEPFAQDKTVRFSVEGPATIVGENLQRTAFRNTRSSRRISRRRIEI